MKNLKKIMIKHIDKVLIINSDLIETDIIVLDKKTITKKFYKDVLFKKIFYLYTKFRELYDYSNFEKFLSFLRIESHVILKSDLVKFRKYDKMIIVENNKIYTEEEYIREKIFWKKY